MRKLSTRYSWLKKQPRFWQYMCRTILIPEVIRYRRRLQEERDYYRQWTNVELRNALVVNGLKWYRGWTKDRLILRYRRIYRFELINEAAVFKLSR